MVEGPDSPLNTWRKSTYSGGGGSDCVEVGSSAAQVLVRDTKNRGGDALDVDHHEWRRFLAMLKTIV